MCDMHWRSMTDSSCGLQVLFELVTLGLKRRAVCRGRSLVAVNRAKDVLDLGQASRVEQRDLARLNLEVAQMVYDQAGEASAGRRIHSEEDRRARLKEGASFFDVVLQVGGEIDLNSTQAVEERLRAGGQTLPAETEQLEVWKAVA